jgi:hypothetical protein
MKFLADMGISRPTVAWLRNANYEVVHLRLGWVANFTR